MILCQITSQSVKDDYAIPVVDGDFAEGGLRQVSHKKEGAAFIPTLKNPHTVAEVMS